MRKALYTIGHSTHEAMDFLALLEQHGISCVVDVRTTAASSFNPQYNKAPLRNFLKNHDILYLHFPKEFGARHESPAVLDATGRVDFAKVQQTDAFKYGVERLLAGIEKGFTITLMCSEGNPLECHRFSMISNYLQAEGFDLMHILKDGSIKSQADLEEKLVEKYKKKLPQPSLFEPDITAGDQLKAAYQFINAEIGWKKE